MLSLYAKTVPKALKISLNKILSETLFPYRMDRAEAIKILNLDDNFTKKDLEFKYHNFYNNNSRNNKGSPYIQSKIKGAHDFLLQDRNAL